LRKVGQDQRRAGGGAFPGDVPERIRAGIAKFRRIRGGADAE
jgi:hypothetical protein